MNRLVVYMKGSLEPLIIDEPFEVTMMNMSAAMNANFKFFNGKDVDGYPVCIAMDQVVFMRNESEDD